MRYRISLRFETRAKASAPYLPPYWMSVDNGKMAPNQIGYVALIRGINVGGKKTVKMDELRKALEALGFHQVKTILASGNVLFEYPQKDPSSIRKMIEEKLKHVFGFQMNVIIRKLEDIQKLVDSKPFQKILVTPQTRLYMTFLTEKPKGTLKIPYETPEKDFKILKVSHTEVCSVLTLTQKRGTVDGMDILEKEFGSNITTRNWNTVLKLLKR